MPTGAVGFQAIAMAATSANFDGRNTASTSAVAETASYHLSRVWCQVYNCLPQDEYFQACAEAAPLRSQVVLGTIRCPVARGSSVCWIARGLSGNMAVDLFD